MRKERGPFIPLALQNGKLLQENLSFETQELCAPCPAILFQDIQSKISSLLPLEPSCLQLSSGFTLDTLTSLWILGSAKHIPTSELCTSCSLFLEHSRCLCDTFSPFPRAPAQMSPSQRPAAMTVSKIT